MNVFAGRKRDVDAENGHVDPAGRGEGGATWDCNAEIRISPCLKQVASAKLRITQELSLLLCDNSEGWGRLRREGIYVHLWLVHVLGQQTPIRDCKAIIFQLNAFFKKSQQITSIDEDVEKRGLLCTVGGNVSWGSRCGKQNGGSSTNRTTVRSSSASPGYVSRESENTN